MMDPFVAKKKIGSGGTAKSSRPHHWCHPGIVALVGKDPFVGEEKTGDDEIIGPQISGVRPHASGKLGCTLGLLRKNCTTVECPHIMATASGVN